MDKKTFKSIVLLIIIAMLLVLVTINFQSVMQGVSNFLGLFVSFFLGIIFAFILNRPCEFFIRVLQGKVFKVKSDKVARGLAITITYILVFVLLILIFGALIPQLIKSISELINNLSGYMENLKVFTNQVTDFLGVDRLDFSNLSTKLLSTISDLGSSVESVLSTVVNITSDVISYIVNFILAIIFSVYLLYGKEGLLRNVRRVVAAYTSSKTYNKISNVYHVVVDVFNKYVVGQLTEAMILGSLCFVGMIIFRFDYPLLISVIIAITALVPIVGAYIGGGIAFVLLVIVSPTKALGFVVFIVILQQFEGRLIYPKVVGGKIGLPAIWVLLAITVGGGVGGIKGILFGVPVTAIIYILLKNNVSNKTAKNAQNKLSKT